MLNECCNLETLPHNIHKHTELTRLSLDESGLRELPSFIWQNSKLENLELRRCEELRIVGKKLSNDPGIVGSVRSLNLSLCTQIDALNLSFILDGIQSSLEELSLYGCYNLETLPHNIYKHSELKTLVLDGCIKLVLSSPTDLLHRSLQQLSAVNCTQLQSILLKWPTRENNWRNEYHPVEEYFLLMPGDRVPDTFGSQLKKRIREGKNLSLNKENPSLIRLARNFVTHPDP